MSNSEVIFIVNEMLDLCPEIANRLMNSKAPEFDAFCKLWEKVRLLGYEIVHLNKENKMTTIYDDFIGKKCVIRTYSAGVHFGTLERVEGTAVLLADALRIWYWTGAFTLNAVAENGIDEGSKLSQRVPKILLTEAIEIIPVSPQAEATYEKYIV
ncbi:MAG: hypothetical protein LBT46_15255 [Planctomycetaceae bacterium]|jgi:hypothetical protein|nr:hypothetical protein [Planctomycetaceae bacterium]